MGFRPWSPGESPREIEQPVPPIEPPAEEIRISAKDLEAEGEQDPAPAETDAGGISVWAQRMLLVVEVVVAVWAGMLLAVLPWTPVWTDNPLFLRYPELKAVFLNNFVRGALSGLGLVDIWIGVWDATHYRDVGPGSR